MNEIDELYERRMQEAEEWRQYEEEYNKAYAWHMHEEYCNHMRGLLFDLCRPRLRRQLAAREVGK